VKTNKIHEEFGMSLDSLGSFNDRRQYSTIYLMYKNVLPPLQNCILEKIFSVVFTLLLTIKRRAIIKIYY
jgi:hypothetical protein